MSSWIHEVGSRGQEVKRLQKSLGAYPDGKFGKRTEERLKDYQSDNKLAVDGRSGPATRASLGIEIYPGIDISHHQGDIDWDTVRESGKAEFCWIKMTEGNNYQDPRATQNILDCRAAGIPVGGYHFARPDLHKDPYKEVKNFAKHNNVECGDLRPVLDFETAGDHSADSIHNWVVEFLRESETLFGVRPIIYTGGNMVKYGLYNNTSILDTYTLWHAAYARSAHKKGIKKDRLGTWKEWTVWQWTGSAEVDGIRGNVDRDWLVGGKSGFENILVK